MQEANPNENCVTIGGRTVKRFTPTHMVELASVIRTRYAEAVDAVCKAMNIPAERHLAMRLEASRLYIQRADIIEFLLTPEGQREALVIALGHKTATPEAYGEVDSLGLDLASMATIVTDLAYMKLEQSPATPPATSES